jgi:cytidyltransferase-like protein
MGEYIPYDRRRLEKIAKEEKGKGNVIVLAGGSFDPIHDGHTYFLRKCKNYGDEYLKELSDKTEENSAILFINVKNDKRVKITKGEDRPVFDEGYRAKMVSSIDAVDYSTINPLFNESPTRELARIINPDIMIKGDDGWAQKEKRELRKYLGYKIRFENVKRKGLSSTDILKALSLNKAYRAELEEDLCVSNHS